MNNNLLISDGSWEAAVLPDIRILPAPRSPAGSAYGISGLQQVALGELRAGLQDADPARLMSGSKGGLKIFLLLLTNWKQIPRPAWLLWYLECKGLMEIQQEIWRRVGCTSLVSLHNT